MLVRRLGKGSSPSRYVHDPKLPAPRMLEGQKVLWKTEEEELREHLRRYNDGEKDLLNKAQAEKIQGAHTFDHVHATMTGRPTVVVLGGKEEPKGGNSEAFFNEFFTLIGLVGGSLIQGHGPGTMEKSARVFMNIRRVLKGFSFICRRESRVAGTPLYIGREPIHRYASNGYVTYPAQELMQRGAALMLQGNPFLILAMRGGDGTDLEIEQVLNWMKTRGELKTPFEHILPNLLLVGEGNCYERLFEHWEAKAEDTSHERAARKLAEIAALRQKSYVQLENGTKEAAERAFRDFCEAFARVHGCGPDELFQFDNGITVYEAASQVRERMNAQATGNILPFSTAKAS